VPAARPTRVTRTRLGCSYVTDLQWRGKRQEATALTAAFERGCHGETAYEALQRSQAAAAVWAADDYRLEG
jgi:hypothetical protein